MNAQFPLLKLLAIPSAEAISASVQSMMKATAAAAPKTPQVAVECQPLLLCAA